MAETRNKGTRPGYVKVEGLDRLRKDLRRMEDKLSRKQLQQTLKADFRAAAEEVAVAARQRVPHSGERRTGRLAATIRPKGALRGTTVLAGGIKGVKYAGPVHWGWPTRPNKSKGWRGGPIKGYPFMWLALKARQGEIKARMEQTVAEVAAQVKGA